MSIEELQEQVLDFPTYKSLRACTLAFLAVLLLALLVKIAYSENYVYFFYKLLSRHKRLHIHTFSFYLFQFLQNYAYSLVTLQT